MEFAVIPLAAVSTVIWFAVTLYLNLYDPETVDVQSKRLLLCLFLLIYVDIAIYCFYNCQFASEIFTSRDILTYICRNSDFMFWFFTLSNIVRFTFAVL